tara:strand:+ start:320 stop:841 length:522 start_codon:yes stop_codon:yes gene_type:complete
MLATYIPRSFNEENAKHSKCILALKKYYQGVKTITELPGKNDEGCDLLIGEGEAIKRVEIKTLAGASNTGTPYKTFIVETFTDYNQKYLSGWRAAPLLHNIIFFNLHDKKAYIYNANILRAYVNSNQHLQIPSGTGTGQYNKANNKLCSWGLKIEWQCKEAGFIKSLDLSHYL